MHAAHVSQQGFLGACGVVCALGRQTLDGKRAPVPQAAWKHAARSPAKKKERHQGADRHNSSILGGAAVCHSVQEQHWVVGRNLEPELARVYNTPGLVWEFVSNLGCACPYTLSQSPQGCRNSFSVCVASRNAVFMLPLLLPGCPDSSSNLPVLRT